ncbi:hypothetical protein V6N13_064573 [Hibiscus sabdariffa]
MPRDRDCSKSCVQLEKRDKREIYTKAVAVIVGVRLGFQEIYVPAWFKPMAMGSEMSKKLLHLQWEVGSFAAIS